MKVPNWFLSGTDNDKGGRVVAVGASHAGLQESLEAAIPLVDQERASALVS